MVKSFLRRLRVSVAQDEEDDQFELDAKVPKDASFAPFTPTLNSCDESFDVSDCSIPSSEDNYGTPSHDSVLLQCSASFEMQNRYCVLGGERLNVYENKKAFRKKKAPKHSLAVSELYAQVHPKMKGNCIRLRTSVSHYTLKMKTEKRLHSWINGINSASRRRRASKQRLQGDNVDDKLALHIYLIEAFNVNSSDLAGTSDPYCKIRVEPDSHPMTPSARQKRRHKSNRIVYESSVRFKTTSPQWNETFTFLAVAVDDSILVEIFDYDPWKKDDFLGCCRVSLKHKELLEHKALHGWFPLFDDAEHSESSGLVHMKIALAPAAHFDSDLSMSSREFIERRSSLISAPMPQYTKFDDEIDVWVGSWNVGNSCPPSELDSWLPPHPSHTIYVIGTQECQYTSNRGYSSCQADWVASLKEYFGTNYVMVSCKSLWEIRLCIFVVRRLANDVSKLHTMKQRTGIGNVMGNKGAVMTSFMFRHTTFSFICCHLAAHQTRMEARHANIRDIMRRLVERPSALYHHTFILGDLNYRLDYGEQKDLKTPSPGEFIELTTMISQRMFGQLFEYDQLQREKGCGAILSGFEEGTYSFPPTFKLKKNRELQYDEKRSPAWTDRILWKSYDGSGNIRQTSLRSHQHVMTSDHKPVSADFKVGVFLLGASQIPSRGRAELTFTDVRVYLHHRHRQQQQQQQQQQQDNLNIRRFTLNAALNSEEEDDEDDEDEDDDCHHSLATKLLSKPFVRLSCEAFEDGVVKQMVSQDNDDAAPEFTSIKLKHNNLHRLKQTLICVELIEDDVVIGRGVLTFDEFLEPLPATAASVDAVAPRASLLSPSRSPHTLSLLSQNSRSPHPSKFAHTGFDASGSPASAHRPSRKPSIMSLHASFTPSPRSRPGRSFASICSSTSPSRRTSSLASVASTSTTLQQRDQIAKFASVQSNVNVCCDFTLGSEAIGELVGSMRLSWAF